MAVERIFCNVCGQEIEIRNGILKTDLFEVTKEWGYFSNKDLEIHKFKICEACYDKLIASFKVPVKIIKKTEIL